MALPPSRRAHYRIAEAHGLVARKCLPAWKRVSIVSLNALSIKTETSAAELACTLDAFLAEHPRAAVLEDGRVLFEMQAAHYALSAEHGRCVLHLWSEDRNLVRTVTDLAARKNVLRLETRRFGQTKPQMLQLVPDRDMRTPTTREATRKKYLRMLERVMTRTFPDFTLDSIGNAMDLEHSFWSGVCTRHPRARPKGVGRDRRDTGDD